MSAPDPSTDSAAPVRHSVVVAAAEAGQRLDRVLAAHLADPPAGLSRARLQALIADGRVGVAGQTLVSASYRVKPGERIEVVVPAAAPATPQAQDIPLVVVYEDADVIVVDKPAGLVVHPAPGNPERTLVNALLHHCGESLRGIGGVRRPGIVHRLDKDTSGLIVAAKTDAAHRALVEDFAARRIERLYLAVVRGTPAPAAGEIAGAIGRSPHDRKKMAVVARGGKTALTRYRVRRTLAGGAAALVECRLATGRTHQIRVHMAAIGHPLLGDPLYGHGARSAALDPAQRAAVRAFGRQALHAVELGFRHPASGALLRFASDLPADMRALMEHLG